MRRGKLRRVIRVIPRAVARNSVDLEDKPFRKSEKRREITGRLLDLLEMTEDMQSNLQ